MIHHFKFLIKNFFLILLISFSFIIKVKSFCIYNDSVYILDDMIYIHFKSNVWEINTNLEKKLDSCLFVIFKESLLSKNEMSNLYIEVNGNSDRLETGVYDSTLSQKRAYKVKDFLVQYFNVNNIIVNYHANSLSQFPIEFGYSEFCYKDRRVTMKFYSYDPRDP